MHRTIEPKRIRQFIWMFWISMTVSVGVVIVTMVTTFTMSTKFNDLKGYCEQLIYERDMSAISSAISNHAVRNKVAVDRENVKRSMRAVERFWDQVKLPGFEKFDIYAILVVEDPWFNSSYIGKYGEIGQGQLMPETVATLRRLLRRPDLDPFVPEDNIYMMLKWLEFKQQDFRTRDMTIIGYNGIVSNEGKVKDTYLKKVEITKQNLQREYNKALEVTNNEPG